MSFLADPFIGPLDPFIGDPVQSSRMLAKCVVMVAHKDITAKLDPHLISVRILDEPLSKCEIEIDDRDGRLPLPGIGSPCEVLLGWSNETLFKVFGGSIQDIEYGFGRKQGGRRMWVHAQGADLLGTHMKAPLENSLGEGEPPGQQQGTPYTLADWLQKIAPTADATVDVGGKFNSIKNSHWSQQGESWLQMVQGLAEKYGAMHQFTDGNHTTFLEPGIGGSCRAVWGKNLIGCRVRPFNARSVYGGGAQQWYNWASAGWDVLSKAFGGGGGGAGGFLGAAASMFALPHPAPNKQSADSDNEGADNQQGNMMGHGRIVLNGEPIAAYNGLCALEGVRPGVDGEYLIWTAEHQYSRMGYITFLDVTPFTANNASALNDRAWTIFGGKPVKPGADVNQPGPPPPTDDNVEIGPAEITPTPPPQ